jgi:hypothetical protein
MRADAAWLLWAAVLFLLLADRAPTRAAPGPGADSGAAPMIRLAAGLATLLLSGLLGFLLLWPWPPPSLAAFALEAAAALIGLWALPLLPGMPATPPPGSRGRLPRRTLGAVGIVPVVALIAAGQGRALLILAGAAAIGLFPRLYGANPWHRFGLLLLPAALLASGQAALLAHWLGLTP